MAFEERELMEDTLFVFTADHGEALGEHHRWFCHGHSPATHNVHVPLILHFPDASFRPGTRTSDVVQHLDVSATILDAFGLRRRGDPRLTLFEPTEGRDTAAIQQLGWPGEGQRYIGISRGKWHLVQREEARPRLFDLSIDPNEAQDLASSHPEIADALLERYGAEARRLESEPILAISDDPSDRRRRARPLHLGYGPGDDQD